MSRTKPVAVITGANAGLGFQTAIELARADFHVVMACRNRARAARARTQLLAAVPAAQASVLTLDVSEPRSIRRFVAALKRRVDHVDVLVNNAGIAVMPLARNSAGHEMQLATNHLGAFALTGLLLPLFRGRRGDRIVNVGSLAHRLGRLDLDDLDWERTPYDEWRAYARSKLAVLSFTLELQRRLRASGSRVIALAAHPGFAATEISRNSPTLQPRRAPTRWLNQKLEKLIPSAAQACAPIVHAALAASAKGGEYYGPAGLLEIAGARVGKARLNRAVRDPKLAARLWQRSESMSGVRYLSAPAQAARAAAGAGSRSKAASRSGKRS
jgi:NAD(P)-dependent dehydrogenase (short-subunit alcohol dehydrogenase family)